MAESENTANTEMNMAYRKAAGMRRESLDAIRGAALISMIAYHACWDLVWIFGVRWDWYRSYGAYLWQQSICWTFILLSGYCFSLSRRPFRRGVVVFACGALVTAVTVIFMPDNRVFFGVLSLLGSAALLTAAVLPLLRRISALCRIPALYGCCITFALFLLTRHTSGGTWCFGLFRLPAWLYRNDLTACFGFPPKGFFSTDYFPLLPWLFLFWTGYYLFRLLPPDRWKERIHLPRIPLLAAMGRRSLLIYLLHQPVIYGVLALWNAFRQR